MADKVKELAEKLCTEIEFRGGKVVESTPKVIANLLRAELKPLLDAADDSIKKFLAHHNSEQGGGYNDMGDALMKLRAELQGWATQRGGLNDDL